MSVSRWTTYRSKKLLKNEIIRDILSQNIPLSPHYETTDDGSAQDHEDSEPMSVDNCAGISDFKYQVDIETVMTRLISESGLTKSQASDVSRAINILQHNKVTDFERFNFNKFWNHVTSQISRNYWFICNDDHAHGPYVGEPRFFKHYDCRGVLKVPLLKNGSYFVTLSLREYLRNYLPVINQFIRSREQLMLEDGRDIATCFLAKKARGHGNLSLTMMIDEVPGSLSSHLSVLPIIIIINELKSNMRYKFAFISTLFHGPKKPKMSRTLLMPLIEELKDLESKSIDFICQKTGQKSSYKSSLVAIIADAPMRAYIKSTKQFNAKYGCDWCKIEGQSFARGSMKFMYKDLSDIENLLRTKQDYVSHLCGNSSQMSESSHIKYVSPMLHLKHYDFIWGMSVDIMHGIFLGIMKDMIKRGWLNTKLKNKAFFIGKSKIIRIIYKRMKSLKVPKLITRPPRELSHYPMWKANEFAAFLIYYFPMILDGLLPSKYIAHLGLLTQGLMEIMTGPIDAARIETSSRCFSLFQRKLHDLYGKDFMTYNAHILIHLPKSVQALGPCGGTSAFSSENEMGLMKKSIKTYTATAQNLMNMNLIHLTHETQKLGMNKQNMNHEEATFFKLNETEKSNHGQRIIMDEALKIFLISIGIENANNIKKSDHYFTSKISISTFEYDTKRARANSCIKYGNKFLRIMKIYFVDQRVIISTNEFIVKNNLVLKSSDKETDFMITLKHIHIYDTIDDNEKFYELHESMNVMIYEMKKN